MDSDTTSIVIYLIASLTIIYFLYGSHILQLLSLGRILDQKRLGAKHAVPLPWFIGLFVGTTVMTYLETFTLIHRAIVEFFLALEGESPFDASTSPSIRFIRCLLPIIVNMATDGILIHHHHLRSTSVEQRPAISKLLLAALFTNVSGLIGLFFLALEDKQDTLHFITLSISTLLHLLIGQHATRQAPIGVESDEKSSTTKFAGFGIIMQRGSLFPLILVVHLSITASSAGRWLSDVLPISSLVACIAQTMTVVRTQLEKNAECMEEVILNVSRSLEEGPYCDAKV
ncbi:hypothetical protein Moror_11281 [Moniliophthora roreri MCA 2997]|uniref:Uncharacterized protein n=1 Tax=Moniliophthora roreri (strain MCA 2997) TaxID=1381753 RepID=V2Y7V0_MONRO|nr:hypothetical protein Moror_11281 [Moniliophthora roreri MCA 2997]